ncbi:Hypothetical protein NTJ_10279 [Nesidiocoris tenuis]|uniref:Uncharacterized protein n=1 Tax=Nesidiocoris tenuis TaxID=355587 RepID=A0ABN7AZ68_9HEMI|nr:Hypothetical protein NTJ_10279 [Nesidiocoris tenuis]
MNCWGHDSDDDRSPGYSQRPRPSSGNDPSEWRRPVNNLTKRFAMNIPPNQPNPDGSTGIRRKMVLPPLGGQFDDRLDTCDEADEESEQSRNECGPSTWDERHEARQQAAVPWSCFDERRLGTQARKTESLKDQTRKLKKLISQETEEIESSKAYIQEGKCAESKIQRGFHELAAGHAAKFGKNETILDSELEPEMAAAMLQSEEQGAVLKHTPPAALYGRLFPDDLGKARIKVTAASKKKRGVVVPTRAALHREDQLMDDLDAGIVDYYELGTKKKPEDIPQPIEHEAEGNADQVLGVTESTDVDNFERRPFNYFLSSEPSLHGNYVQIRGSEPPIWFPGYFNINPGTAEMVVVEEPNEILEKAWTNMGPTHINSPYGNILLGKQS